MKVIVLLLIFWVSSMPDVEAKNSGGPKTDNLSQSAHWCLLQTDCYQTPYQTDKISPEILS